MKNKYVLLLLIVTLSSSILVGCANRTSTEQTSNPESSLTSNTEDSQEQKNTNNEDNLNDSIEKENQPVILKIIGTFHNKTDNNYYKFNNDNSLLIYTNTADGEMGVPGQFVQENNKLIMYIGSADEESKETYFYKLDEKILTLIDAKTGKTLNLEKIQD